MNAQSESVASVWRPQPGPQTDALSARHFCNELFFGGAKYGGKTDFLLGDFAVDVPTYGDAWRGALFRKSYPQLEEVIVRSHELYPAIYPGSEYSSQSKTWHFPGGAWLRMRSLEREEDADNYQGHSYCVAEGTTILMADGSYKPIESIRTTDLVMTLEGPKPVVATMPPRISECVVAVTQLGSQVHPVEHPFLLASGEWGSYASLRTDPTYDRESSSQLPNKPLLDQLSVRVVLYGQDRQLDRFSRMKSRESSNGGILPKLWSSISLRPVRSLIKSNGDRQPYYELAQPVLSGSALRALRDDASYAPSGFGRVEDFPRDCRNESYSYGPPLQSQTETCRDELPWRADVEEPSPAYYMPDGEGNTQECTQDRLREYVHPYTGQVRPVSEDNFFGTCVLTPIGLRRVFDLTVKDVNHYITSCGLVSKNTWIGWDELPMWPTPNAYLRLISCLRLGSAEVPTKRIRSTGNPGGVGHKWVKDRFIGLHNALSYQPIHDPVTDLTRIFIPSRVQDNKEGLEKDPGYIKRLQVLSGVSQELLKAWLEGDWDVIAGAYFDVFGPHLILPHAELMAMIKPWSPRWIGGDWGFKHNSAFYWYAQEGPLTLCYDELVVSGLSCQDLAEQIGRKSEGQKIQEFYLSHDAFAQRTDSDTIAEQLAEYGGRWSLPAPERASMDRIGGAQLLYQKFKAKQCLISDKCRELAATVPVIVHDPDKQEQTLKMEGDDSYDGYRYGVYGRLGPKPKPIEVLIQESVTATDPTDRAIQILLAKEKARKTEPMGVDTFTRRFIRRPNQ